MTAAATSPACLPLPRWTKLTGRLLLAGLIFWLFPACQREKGDDSAGFPPPKVSAGENVEFPADNPQMQSIQVAPAESVSEAGAQFTGHLVWDDNRTTSIYSPVAGFVEKVIAEIGQTVKPATGE